jgi:hypothetical protein
MTKPLEPSLDMKTLLAVLALLALPVAGHAAPNIEAAFGNTIVSTYPDGRTGHLWIAKDGTYSSTGRRKTPSSGKWSVKGSQVCLKQKKPSAAPFAFCTPAPDGGIGTTWTAKAVTGEKISVKLVKGIVR